MSELTELTELTDQSPMPFGQYKGKPMEDVPARYLLWLWDEFVHEQIDKPLHRYVAENFNALETEADDYIVTNRPTK